MKRVNDWLRSYFNSDPRVGDHVTITFSGSGNPDSDSGRVKEVLESGLFCIERDGKPDRWLHMDICIVKFENHRVFTESR